MGSLNFSSPLCDSAFEHFPYPSKFLKGVQLGKKKMEVCHALPNAISLLPTAGKNREAIITLHRIALMNLKGRINETLARFLGRFNCPKEYFMPI